MDLDPNCPIPDDTDDRLECEECGLLLDGEAMMNVHLRKAHNIHRAIKEFNDGR